MDKNKRIRTPLTVEKAVELRVGDTVFFSGTIYTARDAAHKRLAGLLKEGKPLPFELEDQVLYYVGPAPTPPGHACGAAGPTTSTRMDIYTPPLIEKGLRGMIGKGLRSQAVIEAMKKNDAVYFAATGGAAALISKSIKKVEVVAYEDLGTEAIHRMYVEDFPCIVVIDSYGNNLYESGPQQYRTCSTL